MVDNTTFSSVDLGPAKTESPEIVLVEDLPPLQKEGVKLAWGVMGLILIFGLLLIGAVIYSELCAPSTEVKVAIDLLNQTVAADKAASSPSPEMMQKVSDAMTKVGEARRASRDFWTSFSQFLLLNLLLPVLTAILGYVFGTMKKET